MDLDGNWKRKNKYLLTYPMNIGINTYAYFLHLAINNLYTPDGTFQLSNQATSFINRNHTDGFKLLLLF